MPRLNFSKVLARAVLRMPSEAMASSLTCCRKSRSASVKSVPPDAALASAGAAGEQRRAVEHDGDAAAAGAVVPNGLSLGQHVLQEQQSAVGDPRQPGPEAPVPAQGVAFGGDGLLLLLPLNSERRVGQHVYACFYEPVSELVATASGAPRLNHSEMSEPTREAAAATPCTACAAISGRSRETAR